MSWVLVMFIYAGMLSKGDSVTMHSVDGFSSKVMCEQAGTLGSPLVKNSYKEYRFVCIPKDKP